MNRITAFRKVRRDGRIIDAQMTLDRMLEMAWPPDLVVSVQWLCNDQWQTIDDAHGILAEQVPGAEAIAVLTGACDIATTSRLAVIDATGATRFIVANNQMIDGENIEGRFGWFEQPRASTPNLFGAVFQSSVDNALLQMDIDADTGAIAGIYNTQ
jgi:hypothetical protein